MLSFLAFGIFQLESHLSQNNFLSWKLHVTKLFSISSGNKSAGKEGIGYQEPIYYRMLPLPILITFTLAYNVGMGSLTWVVATEILPFRSRRWTHTVANVTSNLCWFAVTKTYADISRTFGISCPFFVYGSVCLFGFVFIYVFLPETRGKTPEETAKAFR